MAIISNKRGYAYFVELALAVIIIFIILSGFLESEQTVFSYKQNQDLKENSWYMIKNIDYFGELNTSDLSKLDAYVAGSLSDLTSYDLEIYNDTGCIPIDAGVASITSYTDCPSINATTRNNVVSSIYTTSEDNNISSVRIYLWRKI